MGRGGGSIPVFLGEGGRWAAEDWVGDRNVDAFRGDGGINVGAVPFVGAGTLPWVEVVFRAPGRIKLWRRIGTAPLERAVDGAFCLSPPVTADGILLGDTSRLCGELASDRWVRTCAEPFPSSRARLLRCGRRVRVRLETALSFTESPSAGKGFSEDRVLSFVKRVGALVEPAAGVVVLVVGRAILEDCGLISKECWGSGGR